MIVGKVSELWRYPVKSMAGEQVPSLVFDELGAVGDRTWAMLTETGDIAWGKSYPALMNLSARYIEEPGSARAYGSDVSPVEITLPDGTTVASGGDANSVVSAFTGTTMRLQALQPPENRDHYRWSEPVDAEKIMKILGIGPGEDPPDMSVYDTDLLSLLAEYYAPPGTYLDMCPVHILTTASIRHMQEISGATFDPCRFRPNFVIDTNDDITGLADFGWAGKTMKVGEATLKVEVKTVRCSMPSRKQDPFNLPQNPEVAKSLYETTGRFFGSHLSVIEGGRISTGDEVQLID